MTSQILDLLRWHGSIRDPLVLAVLLAAFGFFVMLFAARPRLYLPLLLFTAPLPKLFVVNEYIQFGSQVSAAFSVADVLLAAAIIALAFRSIRPTSIPCASRFRTAMILWGASILASGTFGLVLWRGVYQPSNLLYAARYLLTLASFPVAARYAMSWRSERGTRRLLQWLAVGGNITIALGIVYYLTTGSGAVGSADMVSNSDESIFRGTLYFFDYSIDMGYYTVTVAILNVMLLSSRPDLMRRIGYGAGLILCILGILLIGERVNLLVTAVAFGYYFVETAHAKHRSVRTGAVFQIACLIAILGIGSAILHVVAPEQILAKVDAISAAGYEQQAAEIMSYSDVPHPIVNLVTSLPIGDFTVRLALAVASLWFFFAHPIGVGFWGQVEVVGWWAHHELVTILVEQGVPGFAAALFFMYRLKQLLWMRRNVHGPGAQLGVLLRSTSAGFFVALIAANTVLLDMKFGLVYWSLVGLWSVLALAEPSPCRPGVIFEENAVVVSGGR